MNDVIMTVDDLADRANAEHVAALASAQGALRHAIAAGMALTAAKANIAHGGFGQWLADHFTASARTARLYMQLAEHAAQLPKDQNGNALPFPIYEAVKLLAEGRGPAEREGPAASELHACNAQLAAELPIYNAQVAALAKATETAGTVPEMHFIMREFERIGQAIRELMLNGERAFGRCLNELEAALPGIDVVEAINSGDLIRDCQA